MREITTDRDWIREARRNDRAALIDGIKRLFNAREVKVDGGGDVWIAGPMRGHWLDDDGRGRIARALRDGLI